MIPAPQYEFNDQQKHALKQARVLEYVTLAYMSSVIVLMYLVMGSSQAMKAAWIEDCLGLIPPLCFLIGNRIYWQQPTSFPSYSYVLLSRFCSWAGIYWLMPLSSFGSNRTLRSA